MTPQLSIAVLGHGKDADRLTETLLVAGAQVARFDPTPPRNPTVPLAESIEVAVVGADVVVSMGSSMMAAEMAEQTATMLRPGALFADVTTGTPATKRKLAAAFANGAYVDVVVNESRHENSEVMSFEASGAGAPTLIEMLAHFHLSVEFVSDVVGEATTRRLLRSFLAKGMAGVFIDTLWAAEALGMQEWAFEEIQREFDSSSPGEAQRFLSDTASNIKRRQIDMIDVVEMLTETGYDSTMIAPIEFTYGRVLHGKKIPFSKAVYDSQ